MITIESGKLARIDLHPIAPDYLLVIPFERGTANRRLAWILKEYRGHIANLTLHIGASAYWFPPYPRINYLRSNLSEEPTGNR
jgi:hypothetical protein